MKFSTILVFSILLCLQTLSFAQAAKSIQIRNLAEGVWLHTSTYTYPNAAKFPSNGLIVQDGEELILIDTAWGELQTVELLKAIESQINLPVTTAIVTHAHGDRAAGVDVLESVGIEVTSHPLTQRITKEHGLPVPNNVFNNLTTPRSTAKAGKLEVIFPGPAHAMDNLLVWLPDEKILFGGCAIRAISATSAGNTAHGDIESWIEVMAFLRDQYKSATTVIPGHGEVGGIELIDHTARLVEALR